MTLLIWAAVLGCAVAWGLPLFTRGTPVPTGASLAAPAPPAGLSLVRLLGQPPAMPVAEAAVEVATASRFQLVGVVAPRAAGSGRGGLALIAIDGKPARPVRVGREVEPGLRLLTVAHRQVELGAGPGVPSITLTLAPLPEAQRGRPDDQGAAMPGAAPPMPGVMPGAMPGAMRVPPLPVVQMPPGMSGGVSPQGLMRQGMGNANANGNLPYQPDGEPNTAVQGGSVAPMR